MTMRRPVVVTGIGCIGPYGIGPDALAAALATGTALRQPIDKSAGFHRPGGATSVARCGDLDLTTWVAPMVARRISDLSRFALATARLAIADAGLATVAGDHTAVALATAFGPGLFTEQLMQQIHDRGGKAASPFLFTDCVANAAAGQVAIDIGARGPNVTIQQREAGPLLALAAGADDVARGRADLCLAGAVDEMKPLVHSILDRMHGLARGDDDLPRPFDVARNGVLAGEGCTILVLEPEDAARARGARILARIDGIARAFDPTAPRAGYGTGAHALAATLRARLPEVDTVDAIVSGASGSRRGDRLEAGVLHAAIERLPPVVTPKAVHGEFGGGTLAAALLTLGGATFGRPTGCTHPDPTLAITPHVGALAARSVLLTGLGSGGAAAWVRLAAGDVR